MYYAITLVAGWTSTRIRKNALGARADCQLTADGVEFFGRIQIWLRGAAPYNVAKIDGRANE